MENEHPHAHEDKHLQRTRSVSKLIFVGFIIVAGYFLLTEHRAHTIAYLPFLLLLACPLMHFFMHGGHAGHDKPDRGARGSKEKKGEG